MVANRGTAHMREARGFSNVHQTPFCMAASMKRQLKLTNRFPSTSRSNVPSPSGHCVVLEHR